MEKDNLKPIYNDTFQKRSKPKKSHRHRNILITLLISLILIGGGSYFWYVHRSSSISSYQVRGAMITQDDGYVDFQQLQDSGIKFVYLKATSGASYKDDQFENNYNRVSGSDVQVGIYHDFSFTTSAKEQYEYIVSQIKKESGTLPIVVHVTYYQGKTPNTDTQGKKLARLLKMLANHYDQDCIVWASPSIQKQMVDPFVTKSKRMLTIDKLHSKRSDVKFIQYVGKDKLMINRKSSNLLPAVFNGNAKEWKSYLK